MQLAAPSQRGIHRRMNSARAALCTLASACEARAIFASTVILIVATAATGAASAGSVIVAAVLIWAATTLRCRAVVSAGSMLLAIALGTWLAADFSPWAILIAALWLPVVVTSTLRLATWLALIGAPSLGVSLFSDSMHARTLVVLALAGAVAWQLSRLLLDARTSRAELAFDAAELEQVICTLQESAPSDGVAVVMTSINPPPTGLETSTEANFGVDTDLVNVINDSVIELDEKLRVTAVNNAALRLIGRTRLDITGAPLAQFVTLQNADCPLDLARYIDGTHPPLSSIEMPDDTALSVGTSGLDFSIYGRINILAKNKLRLVFHDISESRDAQRMAHFYATHDAATGLPHYRQLQIELRTLAPYGGVMALCIIDLDRFGSIIENLGHDISLTLLRNISTGLFTQLNTDETLYSLGSDVFAVILLRPDRDSIERMLESLRQYISTVVVQQRAGELHHSLTASIGATLIESKHNDPDTVLRQASIGRNVASHRGGNRSVIYDANDSLVREFSDLTSWTSAVRAAIEENRLTLYLQPIKSLRPDLASRAELLLRLEDETGQVWKPEHFLPAAERHHLMPEIDRWVVNRVIRALQNDVPDLQPYCSIALNLSGQSLSEPDFRAFVLEALRAAPEAARRICIEITETSMLATLDDVAEFFNLLRALGCSRLAHRLGMRTVAEFVGNTETLAALQAMGVDYAQGELIGVPRRIDTLGDRVLTSSSDGP